MRNRIVYILSITSVAIIIFLGTNRYHTPATYMKHLETKIDVSSPLLIKERDKPRICVVVESTLPKYIIMHRINNLLVEKVMYTSEWKHAGYQQAPTIDEGCASKIRIPHRRMERFEPLGPGLTETPGPYRGVLIVLSERRADLVLGPGKLAELGSYEIVQVDTHTFVEVTSLVVVRESALDHPSMTDFYLPLLIGLSPKNDGMKP